MNKLVVGLGLSGRSAAKFLLERSQPDEQVIGVDRNLKQHHLPETRQLIEQGLQVISEDFDLDFSSVNQVILSPGIATTHPWVQKALSKKIEVIGEIELAFRHIKRPLIGITGTNGKTTTTLLVTHILNFHGIEAEALGNVGIPLTSSLNKTSIGVVELSSFQIETLASRKLEVGALLNITPDHLDRYKTLNCYAEAKFKIQSLIKPEGTFIVENESLKNYPQLVARDFVGYDWSSPLNSLPPHKTHDVENCQVAYLITSKFGITEKQFLDALKSFKKPPHRIEFVKELHGISFWNDSKGTNVDATIRAVETMQGQVHLIAGGVDKGFTYEGWIVPFKKKVKSIHLIGESAEKIERELSICGNLLKAGSLEEALKNAFKVAAKGENILLSPGCASYDMFRDYADRGDQFKLLVEKLS